MSLLFDQLGTQQDKFLVKWALHYTSDLVFNADNPLSSRYCGKLDPAILLGHPLWEDEDYTDEEESTPSLDDVFFL